jgi:hypothetical protein
MLAIRLSFLLASLALAGAAAARSWQGIDPGTTTLADVTARFGLPTVQGKVSGRNAAVYKGDQAISGTRQAQFFTRDDGVVAEVVLFPSSPLDREAVEGTYGKPSRKAFTDEFRPVWVYEAAGITVFFGQDGSVESISFKAAGARGERQRAGARSGGAPPANTAATPEAR